MSTREERLQQANRVIELIGIGRNRRGRLILKNNRVAVEYTNFQGEHITKTWMHRGNDYYPTFRCGELGWGGTMTRAVSMLVRYVNGKTVLPLRTWKHWFSSTVKLADEPDPVLDYLKEIGWPEVTTCVLCGAEIKDSWFDWWSYVHHGTCCWGAPSDCGQRNGREWDYNEARWKTNELAAAGKTQATSKA